ncbi:MAG: hypothetical protein DDT26_00874 [Dehalococcoidia bacterium]|nr:hypothetical protein [Chloroflexota bacterium]
MAGDLFVFYLKVGENRGAAGAPVGDTFPAIDEPLLIEIDEGSAHRPAGSRLHGEGLSTPVTRDPEPLVLLSDNIPALIHPLPDMLQESLPAQVMASQSFIE